MRRLRGILVFSRLHTFCSDQYYRAALFVVFHAINLCCSGHAPAPNWQFDVAELPPHWGDWVAEYRVAFQEAGITADWIREHLDAPGHLPAADQEFLINMRVAEHNNPDGAPFAQGGNHVVVYGAYMSAAARNTEPRQRRRRRAAPSSTTAQTTSPAADPITRSGDPASRFPSQANTRPSLPEVWAQLDAIDLVEEF